MPKSKSSKIVIMVMMAIRKRSRKMKEGGYFFRIGWINAGEMRKGEEKEDHDRKKVQGKWMH
jgi:hypothetical protein